MNRKHISMNGNILQQKVLTLFENFKQGSTEEDIKSFTASRGMCEVFPLAQDLKEKRKVFPIFRFSYFTWKIVQ